MNITNTLLDPVILCFIVGLIAGLAKSDLKVPTGTYETLSIFLLFTIGLKGGVALAKSNISDAILPALATIALGVIIPILAYNILRKLGKFDRINAASIAAHYGSVSAVTFAVVLSFLLHLNLEYESYVTVLLVILEIPAIAVGIFIARTRVLKEASLSADTTLQEPLKLKKLIHEIIFGKSVYLLVAGLIVGTISGPERIQAVAPLFFTLFKGALAVFLLEMGLVTSDRFADLKKAGPFLIIFGICMPLISGAMGAVLGHLSGLSIGGTTVLSTLAASASYIAAPAAMRMALPQANPTLSLTASLAITFPFNIIFGIPIYYWMAQTVSSLF